MRRSMIIAALLLTACRREPAPAKPDPAPSKPLASASISATTPKGPAPEPITPKGALHGSGLELRENGDVYTLAGVRLTTAGRITTLALAADQNAAFFLRVPPSDPGDAGAADEPDADVWPPPGPPPAANGSAIWVLREGERPARRSVVSCQPKMHAYGHGDVSPDGKTFYFSITSGGPGTYLVAADSETGTAKLELPSVFLVAMIKEGPDAGQLIATEHRYAPPPTYGATDVVVLVSPAGKVLRDIGPAGDPKVETEVARLRFPGKK